jgi:hypothetical protein
MEVIKFIEGNEAFFAASSIKTIAKCKIWSSIHLFTEELSQKATILHPKMGKLIESCENLPTHARKNPPLVQHQHTRTRQPTLDFRFHSAHILCSFRPMFPFLFLYLFEFGAFATSENIERKEITGAYTCMCLCIYLA